ncbi:hybrid sensor histidine kinase/response regulator [Streptomyces sp. NPDC020875]|uniref:hybrid sensor histidine kinase/response regulator n=1 Tax=Streptomyces sp. NPDC020875 TaxID=3154898 RepID=UPI003408CD3A
MNRHEIVTLRLARTQDVFVLRRCGQAACRALDVPEPGLVRLTTVVSEAGQDLLGAPELTAHMTIEATEPARLTVRFHWDGTTAPGPEILTAAERLLDHAVHTTTEDAAGTETGGDLAIGLELPAVAAQPLADLAARAAAALKSVDGIDITEDLRGRNRELLAALKESRAQQEELQRLNAELEETNSGVVALYSELARELEETNSGVVALYAELEDKSRQLRLASEAKTRFWANVSHELRSPVNSVISLARLLLDPAADRLTPEQRQQTSMIAASGNTLLALVEELLDVAKAESGRLEPHLVETDTRTLLHQLRGTLRGTADDGVRLDIPDPAPEPGPPLVTDEVMLTRILRNILSNGLKFTDHGEVALTVTREDRGGTPWHRFTVRDTGVGIPEDQQDRIFEEFYQVRGPHQRGRPGTGLGLPYARRLTELLGGRLTLTSTPDQGTTVVVEIPSGPATGDTHPGPEPGTPLLDRVVIVDDDPAFLATLRPALHRLARTVTEITRSADAAETIRATRPDAVLLDLMMPAPDGYQLLHILTTDPRTADIPVVVLTSADHDTVDRTRLTRARGILSKTHLSAARLASALTARAHPELPDGDPR